MAVNFRLIRNYCANVSTIGEIEAVSPKSSTEELVRVERAVHSQFRQRGGGIIYDDACGIETEADLIASADEAFQAYDQAEAYHAKRSSR